METLISILKNNSNFSLKNIKKNNLHKSALSKNDPGAFTFLFSNSPI